MYSENILFRKSAVFSFLFSLLIIISFNIFGAYVEFQDAVIIQPDGTEIKCYASGDEFFNWLHDAEGYTIIIGEDGYYYYGIREGEDVVPSEYRVNTVIPEEVGLEPWAKISERLYYERRAIFEEPILRSDVRAPHTGTMNNLVIYIKFYEQSEFEITREEYDDLFNSMDSLSVRNYFREVSYNQLDIISHHYPVCEPTTNLSFHDIYPRNYYVVYHPVNNTIGYRTFDERKEREHTLLRNAILHVRDQIPTNLNIDGDNDGFVDNITFIIRGNSEGWAHLLWAHRWFLDSYDVFINDKQVWDYNFQPENQSTVRITCHELFHSLGAPDLYPYYTSGVPVGAWDLMANGSGHMGAHMKWKYTNENWIESIPVITTSGHYTLNPLTSTINNAYKILSPYSTEEYFVVEYRRQEGLYESLLPGTGLLVYRINPSINGNSHGTPYEVYIYRPGNRINNAHYNIIHGRTAINDYTTDPKSTLRDGSDGGLYIFDVGEGTDQITFSILIDGAPIEGDGTVGNPYQILRLENLRWLATDPSRWDKHYIQTADIDAALTAEWDEGQGWIPIGNNTVPFSGKYNGNGYVIDSLTINRPVGSFYQALFGYTSNAQIENLGLTNLDINGYQWVAGIAGLTAEGTVISNCYTTGNVNGTIVVGGLVGLHFTECSVVNSYSFCNVTATDRRVGGLVGYTYFSNVIDSYSIGTVSGTDNLIGGLIGDNLSSTVSNSYWNVETSGQSSSAAGSGRTTEEMAYPYATNTYVGWDFIDIWAPDTSLFFEGYPYLRSQIVYIPPPEGLHAFVGDGMVELFWQPSIITRDRLNPDFNSNRYLIGYNVYRDGEQINSEVLSHPYYLDSGLLNQMVYNYFVTAVYTEGESIPSLSINARPIISEQFAGGTGSINYPWQIATAEHLDNIRNYLGAAHSNKHFLQIANIDLGVAPWNEREGWNIIGPAEANSFRGNYNGNSYVIQGLYIDNPNRWRAGLFGYIYQATISNLIFIDVNINGYLYVGSLAGESHDSLIMNSSATGLVSGTSQVGGLVGVNDHNSVITNCYSTAEVNGSYRSGGLVGSNVISYILDSYSVGNVNGDNSIGGLVGRNYQGAIRYSYSKGLVTGVEDTGGLVGLAIESGIYEDTANYWNTQTSGQNSSEMGQGRTTAEMTYPYGANTYVGWDFDDIWAADQYYYKNNGYPYLIWQEGMIIDSYPWTEDFTGYDEGTIPESWFRTHSNWGINNSSHAGGEVPEMRFIWSPQAIDSFRLVAPPLTTNGIETLKLTFRHMVDDYSGQGYSLKVQTSDDHLNWNTVWEMSPTTNVPAENIELMLYNLPEDYLFVSWVLAGNSWNINFWFIDDIVIDIFEAFAAIEPELGSGAIGNPYQIATLANLFWIAEDSSRWGYHYLQTVDIDASGTEYWFAGTGWMPIGNETIPFSGSYDGQNHKIENLLINRWGEYQGLFGWTNGATLSNILLRDVDIYGMLAVGSLVGVNENSLINNCSSTGTVSGFDNAIGGLVGANYMSATISNSHSNAVVAGSFHIGGLVGSNSFSSYIDNSYSRGNVTGMDNIGGFVGESSNSYITNCYSTVLVEGTGYSIGGFVGYISSSTVINSYWDTQTSNQANSAAGFGRTTGEMTYPYAANTFVDWDFEDLWTADLFHYMNNGYPYFDSEPIIVTELPWDEDFTGISVNTLPPGWMRSHVNWYVANSSYANGEAPELTFYYYPFSVDTFRAVTPRIMLDNFNTLELSFKHMLNDYSGSGYSLQVQTSPDLENWETIWQINPTDNIAAELVVITLDDLELDYIYLSWVLDGNSYNLNYWYIDDIELTFPPLPTPLNLTALAGDGVVELNWEAPESSRISSSLERSDIIGHPERISTRIDSAEQPFTKNAGFITEDPQLLPGKVTFRERDFTRPITFLGYNVYRNNTRINTDPVQETYFADTNVLNGLTYTYQVTSVYEQGESEPSNSAVVMPFASPHFAGGSGSANYPWLIATANHLNNVRFYLGSAHTDKHFKQIAHINLGTSPWNEGDGWIPLGIFPDKFCGNYDGDNHVIEGLYINRPSYGTGNNQGLFGYVEYGTIKNLGLENVNVTGSTNVGGLIGHGVESEIVNCFVYGNINGEENVGLLIGMLTDDSIVSNSHSIGNIYAIYFVGGLIGWNGPYNEIMDSFSSGNIIADDGAGGLIGVSEHSNISNCYVNVNVTSDSNWGIIGGLVSSSYYTLFENNYSIGSVDGAHIAGGFIGQTWGNDTFINSYWNMETSGQTISYGGEGRTTAEMTYPYAPNTFVNWDFSDIWSSDQTYLANNGYPYHGWQSPLLPPYNLFAEAGHDHVLLVWDTPLIYSRNSDHYLNNAKERRRGESASELDILPQDRNDKNRNLMGYNVYRDGLLINQTLVTDTFYLDLEVMSETIYSYYVTTLYATGESIPSAVVEVETQMPPSPITLPFYEDWETGNFITNNWDVTRWNVDLNHGNPAPAALFNYWPRVYDYINDLESWNLNGLGAETIIAHFDLSFSNYTSNSLEQLSFQVFDGFEWITVLTFNNIDGDIPWTTISQDISNLATDRIFRIRFRAQGEDSWNINHWYIDNILIEPVYHILPAPEVSIYIHEGIVTLEWEPIAGANSYFVYSTDNPNSDDWGEPVWLAIPIYTEPVEGRRFYKVVASPATMPVRTIDPEVYLIREKRREE